MAKRTQRTAKVLTIAQANTMAAGYAEVSADPVDPALWLVEGDGWTEMHEPMSRAALARLLADKCLAHDGSGTGEGKRAKAEAERQAAKVKTYEATMPDGRKVRCTVPEHDAVAYSGDAAEVLRDVLCDSFGPQAVAVMANALRVQLNSGVPDAGARREIRYLADLLVGLLGGEKGYRLALTEAGL